MKATKPPSRIHSAIVLIQLALELLVLSCVKRFSRRPRRKPLHPLNNPIKRL